LRIGFPNQPIRVPESVGQIGNFRSIRGGSQDGLASLQIRDTKEYTSVLMQGMRYPMPTVAKRAADAMIALGRKDMLSHLVDFLGEAGPERSDPKEDR